MLIESEIDQLCEQFYPYLLKKNSKRRRRQIVGPVITVIKKVYCTAHSELTESELSRDVLFEKFKGNKYLFNY